MEEIDEAVLDVWKLQLDNSRNLDDADRGVRNVREFLQKHDASRFDSGNSHEFQIRDCAGYRHGEFFLFHDIGFKEACGDFDTRQVASELKKRGLLAADDPYRFKSKRSLPWLQGRQRFYMISENILDED